MVVKDTPQPIIIYGDIQYNIYNDNTKVKTGKEEWPQNIDLSEFFYLNNLFM
jgi:hypothetical protein